MKTTINAKELRASLPEVVRRVGKGARFTVLYRSRPAFEISPVVQPSLEAGPLEDDPVFRMGAFGSSTDGSADRHHDDLLYGE